MRDFRDFLNVDDVKKLVATSVNYEGEDPNEARTLLLFTTSTQQTWLIATSRRLYCALDDRRKPNATVQWSMPIVEARTAAISKKEYRDRTGLLDIGKRTNWLYTKGLFKRTDVIEGVRNFIRQE
jgi:hypothetical protein